MTIKIKRIPKLTLRSLIRRANKDTDPASLHFCGSCDEDIDGAVLVLKGKKNVSLLKSFLLAHQLITPGNRVPL